MVGACRRVKELRAPTAARWLALVMAPLTVSSCAPYRPPAANHPMTEARRATCDDFARAEVARLGESVPGALVKGFVIGLALEVSWALLTVHTPDGETPPVLPPNAPPLPPVPVPLFSWAAGGSRLARDAARTNEDVYEQAIETCMAPVRLAEEFGHQDARVATSLERLADSYGWQRRYSQAEPLRREAVAIWEGVFGPRAPRVARALDEHARVLRLLHRGEEADSLGQRAAMIRAQLQRDTARPVPASPGHASNVSCDSRVDAALFVMCRGASRPWDVDGHSPIDRP